MTFAQIQEWTAALYEARKQRQSHPEGEFDSKGRWYPSGREDQRDVCGCVRSPSRAWPYSYMLRARTRQHCKTLVEAAIAGKDVPSDVWSTCPARSRLVAETPTGIVRDFVLGA